MAKMDAWSQARQVDIYDLKELHPKSWFLWKHTLLNSDCWNIVSWWWKSTSHRILGNIYIAFFHLFSTFDPFCIWCPHTRAHTHTMDHRIIVVYTWISRLVHSGVSCAWSLHNFGSHIRTQPTLTCLYMPLSLYQKQIARALEMFKV